MHHRADLVLLEPAVVACVDLFKRSADGFVIAALDERAQVQRCQRRSPDSVKYSYGPCSDGPYSYGPCSDGPCSDGPYSYGLYTSPSPALPATPSQFCACTRACVRACMYRVRRRSALSSVIGAFGSDPYLAQCPFGARVHVWVRAWVRV